VTLKKFNIKLQEDQWSEKPLEINCPLDFEDKWGKSLS